LTLDLASTRTGKNWRKATTPKKARTGASAFAATPLLLSSVVVEPPHQTEFGDSVALNPFLTGLTSGMVEIRVTTFHIPMWLSLNPAAEQHRATRLTSDYHAGQNLGPFGPERHV
jgi:hypothetical protein